MLIYHFPPSSIFAIYGLMPFCLSINPSYQRAWVLCKLATLSSQGCCGECVLSTYEFRPRTRLIRSGRKQQRQPVNLYKEMDDHPRPQGQKGRFIYTHLVYILRWITSSLKHHHRRLSLLLINTNFAYSRRRRIVKTQDQPRVPARATR